MAMTVIETRLRKIGTSWGVILPREALKERNIREGESISVILPQKKKLALLEKVFGSAKGAKAFIRDRKDRVGRLDGRS